MAEQIGLSLPVQSSEGIDEFYISDCNTMAVNLLENWKNWPNLKHILSGPPASGKTHLGRIWAKQVNATYTNARDLQIIDIDKIATQKSQFWIDNRKYIQKDKYLKYNLLKRLELWEEIIGQLEEYTIEVNSNIESVSYTHLTLPTKRIV